MHAEDLGFAHELWRTGEAVARDRRADREVGQLCLRFSGGTEPYRSPVLSYLDTKPKSSTSCMLDSLLGPWEGHTA